MTTAWRQNLHARPRAVDERELISEIAGQLLADGTPTAPHVVAKLLRRLNADATAVRETAADLTASQRGGQRMLPEPLPLVESIRADFGSTPLDAADRFVLLLAAISTDERIEILLGASSLSVEEIIAGALGEHLTLAHGRYAFVDARMPIWLQHTAAPLDVTRAHERLRQIHRERGEVMSADWHRARGALERIPAMAPVLAEAARELIRSGHPERAFTVAVEAADHAEGDHRDEARLAAGAAAVAAACFEDAADWLSGMLRTGTPEHRCRAMATVLIAETCAHGSVPALDPAEHRPRGGDRDQWRAWARAAGLAAMMCAERGAVSAMRSWLAEVREADSRAGAGGEIRDSAVSLCWLLTGEAEAVEVHSHGPFSGELIGALCTAVEGDIDRALQMLVRARAGLTAEPDALVFGFERSPLVDAYLAVTEALLHFWRGDVQAARERLSSACVDLPVGVPFAGLGTALALRLDIAVTGQPGGLSQVLLETLPRGIRIDRLVDNGLSAYLEGAHEQAATYLSLWRDRGAPEPVLAVPGADEVGPIIERIRVEPPELTETRELLGRLRRLGGGSWRREHDEIADAGRSLNSAFCRGRIEAMLGSVSTIHGDVSAGRRHLRAARSLFEDSGALAWRDAVDEKLARLTAQLSATNEVSTVPIAVIDPVAASRAAWSAVLRERELEVAMRVVEGRSNREIAGELEISVRTVEVHVGRILSALEVRNRVELTVLAHRTGRHF